MTRHSGEGEARASAPGVRISRSEWDSFLSTYSRDHRGWRVRLETHDRVTAETVTSAEMWLESIEYDLEDEKNPRINVIVRFDNKTVKHILFLPSEMTLTSSDSERTQSLHVTTLNTETTVHLLPLPTRPVHKRPPAG